MTIHSISFSRYSATCMSCFLNSVFICHLFQIKTTRNFASFTNTRAHTHTFIPNLLNYKCNISLISIRLINRIDMMIIFPLVWVINELSISSPSSSPPHTHYGRARAKFDKSIRMLIIFAELRLSWIYSILKAVANVYIKAIGHRTQSPLIRQRTFDAFHGYVLYVG